MTNINSASPSAPTAPIAHEAPSLLRLWWKNKKLQCHIAIATAIIILNIEALVYMIIHKIHIPFSEILSIIFFEFYLGFGVISCVYWFRGIKDASQCVPAEIFGWVCHISGFSLLLYLLYYISPLVSLLVGLHLGLPSLRLIVPSTFGQAICKGLRDWWMSVNQPQLVVDTSQGGVPV